jgi:hypothetical protein
MFEKGEIRLKIVGMFYFRNRGGALGAAVDLTQRVPAAPGITFARCPI